MNQRSRLALAIAGAIAIYMLTASILTGCARHDNHDGPLMIPTAPDTVRDTIFYDPDEHHPLHHHHGRH